MRQSERLSRAQAVHGRTPPRDAGSVPAVSTLANLGYWPASTKRQAASHALLSRTGAPDYDFGRLGAAWPPDARASEQPGSRRPRRLGPRGRSGRAAPTLVEPRLARSGCWTKLTSTPCEPAARSRPRGAPPPEVVPPTRIPPRRIDRGRRCPEDASCRRSSCVGGFVVVPCRCRRQPKQSTPTDCRSRVLPKARRAGGAA